MVESYEIGEIEAYIQKIIWVHTENILSLKSNNNTLNCEIYIKKYSIHFPPKDCIGHILGFSTRVLEPNIVHSLDLPVNIVKVRTIQLDSNIIAGAFNNNRPSHTIYNITC